MRLHAALFAALLPAASVARAEDTPAPPPAPAPAVEDTGVMAYGGKDVACLTWTDSCQLCLRAPDGRIVCSTPGIACTPAAVVCTRKKAE